ncbi:sulfite exporter TauE/SafE family protein [Martelella lutilitoris]|uniref:Probable membrane transporter protein n=1 Tax=Martelella lutilitoris TaxID=2583532 RepID=A0A7T7KKF2_9HYPH|nr:sulfite exporter TauE/SafE family protein [Martelella lutilitoris]QQM29493.1 sulfite exporter TauE/SafE family protein [Martelella lutilitoris]
MPELAFSLPVYIGFALVLSVGAFFRGFAGFGMALVAMPLLILLVPPQSAILALMVVQIVLSSFDMRECLGFADRRAVFLLAVAAFLGTPIGLIAIGFVPLYLAQIIIGAIAGVAALVLFFGLSLKSDMGAASTGLVGFLSGLFGGLAAAPGPPVVAYFLARDISPREKRASMILLFAIMAAFALLTAAVRGTLGFDIILLGLISSPFCYAGSALGAACFRRGSDDGYRVLALAAMEFSALFSIALGLYGGFGG